MNTVKIKDLKRGDYFRLTSSETSSLWVRGEYDRSLKAYSCYKFEDTNHEKFFKASKVVFIEFDF